MSPEGSAPRSGPIFILGAMGSGTTLLRLMLDSHPNVAIPPETGFMRAYRAQRFIPFKSTGGQWYRHLGWTPQEFDAHLAQFYDTMFRRYADEHGKQRWGEKTPLHVWHAPGLMRMFPDAAFVGIVRHPGASVASNFRRWREPVERYVWHWVAYNREIVRLVATMPERAVLLRYEDLVREPERVMRELLEWLGEPWSDDVLAHHEIQSRRGGRMVVEGRTNVADPVDVSRVAAWTKDFTNVQRALVARRTAAVGRVLGYDSGDPLGLEPMDDEEGLVLDGRRVAAVMERYPKLRLEERGRVPGKEQFYKPWNWKLVPHKGKLREPTVQPRREAARLADLVGGRLPERTKRRLRRRTRRLRDWLRS